MTAEHSSETEPLVIVENARPEDAEAVYDVQTAAWLATYPNEEYGITKEDIEERRGVNNPELKQEKIDRWKETTGNQSNDKAVFVARLNGRVVGFTAPYRLEDGRFRPGAVYVDPHYQRRGIGKKLFLRTLDFMGDGELVVHVASYNKRAISFYKKFGFIEKGPLAPEQGVGNLPSGAFIPEVEMIRPALNK